MDKREKVIIGMEACSDYKPDACIKNCPYRAEGCRNAIKLMQDALELLKAGEPGWISVDKALPEEGVTVLVWGLQGFSYLDKLMFGVWQIGGNNNASITHWMPLPEPPKEG